jgi:hypothetical protein
MLKPLKQPRRILLAVAILTVLIQQLSFADTVRSSGQSRPSDAPLQDIELFTYVADQISAGLYFSHII